MALLFWCSVGLLVYVYVGYPLVLWLLVRLRGARPIRKGEHLPKVSLVISAYNEAAVIRQKLENAISLDYPADRLQVVVISDASFDATDDIVRSFAPRVELLRQQQRRGKTAGLNRFVPGLFGDVVVFSDANAMYDRRALRMLVRNFTDPEVGCVTGEARYLKGDQSTAGVSERVYWDYELWIKRLETEAGSLVGGDGAIYAIRRRLWRTLPDNAINDFLNPLQIVAAGFRSVFDADAVCYEEPAGSVAREWRRRTRIVSRSWRAVFQAPGVLNPMRVGLFSFSLISHKVLRWFSGLFALAAVIAGIWLAVNAWALTATISVIIGILTAGALIGARPLRRIGAFGLYFTVINIASLLGVIRGTLGYVSGVWTPPRAEDRGSGVRVGLMLLCAGCVGLLAGIFLLASGSGPGTRFVFWACFGLIAYVYCGYALALGGLSATFAKPIIKSAIEPRVALLIAANNEARVIGEKLENSLALDYPRDKLEVIVASDGSHDGTNEIVRSFQHRGVRLLEFRERRGKMSVINDAMATIEAEIVVLSDANTFLSPVAIRMLVRNFADEQVGAVSGDVVLTGERASLAGSEDLYYRYERNLQRLESRIGSLIGVDGALYALRRSLFVPPPVDTILDDMAVPMGVLRAGWRVVFEEEALGNEVGSGSSAEEFSRKSRVTAGAVQFLKRTDSSLPGLALQPLFTLISHKALRWFSPAFAALSIVASLLLAPGSVFFSTVVMVELCVISAALLGCVPAIRRIGVIAVAHYVCLVQAAAAFGFLKGLADRQAVAWRRFARTRVQPT